jgi:tetratricopeptide (TPR) repeat protein/TolB-like protein
MADQASRLQRFWADLKRRRIFQTGALYVVVAWAIIQAASIALPTFGLPAWMMRAVLVAAFAGFPVVLVLAWVFDVSGQGLEVTSAEDAERAGAAPSRTRRWLRPLIAAPVLALIVGGTAWLWTARLATTGESEFAQAPRPDELRVVAVLPLENLTGRKELDWAGTGLATLIRDTIAQSQSIAVVSAARTLRLAPAGSRIDTIMSAAAEAGVTHVLSGEILRTPKGLTVTSRLTDLRRNVELGANRQEGVADEALLGIATPVAGLIKQSLGLPATEKIDVFAADFAVQNAAAYEAFIAGMENFLRFDYLSAKASFEAAIARAPDFAMAHYRLAHTLASLGDLSGAADQIRLAVQGSARLPDRDRRYVEAMQKYIASDGSVEAYRGILERYPYESEARTLLVYALDSAGQFEPALVEAQRLAEQDPGDEVAWSSIAHLALKLERYPEAQAAIERLRQIAPDNPNTHFLAGEYHYYQRQFELAGPAFEEALRVDPSFGFAIDRLAAIEMLSGRNAAAIERLSVASRSALLSGEHRITAALDLVGLLRAEGRCDEADEALAAVREALESERVRMPLADLALAWCRLDQGRHAEAAALIASAEAGAPSGRASRYLFAAGLLALASDDRAVLDRSVAALEASAGPSGREIKGAAYLRGLAMLADGRAAEAARQIETAIAMPGDGYELYELGLARALAESGDQAGAVRTARQAVNTISLVDPRFDLAHSRALADAIARGRANTGATPNPPTRYSGT